MSKNRYFSPKFPVLEKMSAPKVKRKCLCKTNAGIPATIPSDQVGGTAFRASRIEINILDPCLPTNFANNAFENPATRPRSLREKMCEITRSSADNHNCYWELTRTCERISIEIMYIFMVAYYYMKLGSIFMLCLCAVCNASPSTC